MVCGDSAKPEPRGSKRSRTKSSRTKECKRGEPGNQSNQDIKAAKSKESPWLEPGECQKTFPNRSGQTSLIVAIGHCHSCTATFPKSGSRGILGQKRNVPQLN